VAVTLLSDVDVNAMQSNTEWSEHHSSVLARSRYFSLYIRNITTWYVTLTRSGCCWISVVTFPSHSWSVSVPVGQPIR
jgi:hypothetical protein